MKRINLTILILLSFLISACAGINIIRDRTTGLMQKEQYSNSLFNVSTNYSQYFQCDRETGVQDSHTFIESDVVETEGRNCKLLHGEYASTAGSFGTLAGAGVMLGSAAILADGIRNSGDNVNMNNSNKNKASSKASNRNSIRNSNSNWNSNRNTNFNANINKNPGRGFHGGPR